MAPGKAVSIARPPNVGGADGKQVAANFAGGEWLGLRPGDQVALLEIGEAVIDTIST